MDTQPQTWTDKGDMQARVEDREKINTQDIVFFNPVDIFNTRAMPVQMAGLLLKNH